MSIELQFFGRIDYKHVSGLGGGSLLKKITSEEVLGDIGRRLQKNKEEIIKHLETSLDNESLKSNRNLLRTIIIDKTNQLKEQNEILKNQISILEDIYHALGVEKKYCPTCNSQVIAFLPFGQNPRERAKCPKCLSVERHRATFLFLKERTRVFKDNIKFLHIAPEKIFYEIFSSQKNIDYLTADLNDEPPRVMEKMDIQDIKYPDNTFDFIYCSHVLEHVPDDKKALEELNRVLKTNGNALILVPMNLSLEKTLEDPSINTPELRLKYYSHSDHLRLYGSDFTDKLEDAGFKFLSDDEDFTKDMDEKKLKKYGIDKGISFIYCTKT